MTRNSCCCTFLDENVEIFEDDAAFSAAYTKMKTNTATAVTSATATESDNTGYSADKVTAKNAACEMVSELCGSAQIRLTALDNKTLCNMLNSAKRYYFGMADAMTEIRLQKAHDVMAANLKQLTADYVTAEQLADLQDLIDKYKVLEGKTTSVNTVSTTYTLKYKTDLKLTSANVKSIKKLVKVYKKTQPEFYNGLLKSSKTPAAKVLHTKVTFKIFNVETGEMLENVAGTLSNSKQVPFNDANCVLPYKNVLRDKATATFELGGYANQNLDITILVGKDNKFVVGMEEITKKE